MRKKSQTCEKRSLGEKSGRLEKGHAKEIAVVNEPHYRTITIPLMSFLRHSYKNTYPRKTPHKLVMPTGGEE